MGSAYFISSKVSAKAFVTPSTVKNGRAHFNSSKVSAKAFVPPSTVKSVGDKIFKALLRDAGTYKLQHLSCKARVFPRH